MADLESELARFEAEIKAASTAPVLAPPLARPPQVGVGGSNKLGHFPVHELTKLRCWLPVRSITAAYRRPPYPHPLPDLQTDMHHMHQQAQAQLHTYPCHLHLK